MPRCELPPKSIDIVFLIDASAYMSACFDGLKNNLNDCFTTLANPANSGYTNVNWRAKVVGFRDIERDGSKWFEDNSFVRDVDQLRAQLNNLSADGGGDKQNSLLDAIFVLSQMGKTGLDSEDPFKWREKCFLRRGIVILTESLFKEIMSVSGSEGGTVNDIVNQINSNKLHLFIFAPDDPGFNALTSANYVEYKPIRGSGLMDVTSDPDVFMTIIRYLTPCLQCINYASEL